MTSGLVRIHPDYLGPTKCDLLYGILWKRKKKNKGKWLGLVLS